MRTSNQARRPADNHLLAALSHAELERLAPNVSLVSLTLGQVLYESNVQMSHAYFPTNSIVSLFSTMENGSNVEIGTTGSEGIVGIALFMGGCTTRGRGIVQGAGSAYRMSAEALQGEFRRGGAFQQSLLRYTHALITQISQTAVCNRSHCIEQRLCRWLLLSYDRASTDTLVMTHKLIADMLGVRREGITVAARKLKKGRLISYARGRVTLLDRRGLEAIACKCYDVVKTEYARLLD